MLRGLLIGLLCMASGPAIAERRGALLVGESAGDSEDGPLRFAEVDARRMREVLVSVGGVEPEDARLLDGATAAELRAALAGWHERMKRDGWGAADRFLVYVSAHARDGELHLRGSHFSMAELRRVLDAMPVGVTVLVLDACESGAATRAKGLVPLSGSVVAVERPSLRGRVVIASARAGEASFESDAMGGSLFTQQLVAGLRGAADSSRDGRVSLQEAYAYAYARTVDAAALVRGARQSPVFDLDLAGEGELVLAEPARARSRLVLDLAAAGDWIVSSIDGGTQVVRFTKGVGPATFALEPGQYRLRTRDGDFLVEATVTLADGGVVRIDEADVRRWALVPAGRKGSGARWSAVGQAVVASGAVGSLGALGGWQLGLRHASDAPFGEARLVVGALVGHRAAHAADRSFVEREVALAANGGWEWSVGRLQPRLLLDAGAVIVRQEGLAGGARLGAQPQLSMELGASWVVNATWSIDASAAAGAMLVRTETALGPVPFVVVGAGVGASW